MIPGNPLGTMPSPPPGQLAQDSREQQLVQPIPLAPFLKTESGRRPRSRDVDPVLSYQFSVELTEDPFGLLGFKIPITGYFSEISGLDVEWETAEYKSTNVLGLPHSNFVPMRPVYQPIVLKRGITDSEAFWLWHQLLALGAKPLLKCYVMITMYNRSYEPIVQWSVERAWPSKISGPQIRADSSDIVIEEMTLTHGGIQRMYLTPDLMGLSVVMQMMLP
jgi:phage tail-like protein